MSKLTMPLHMKIAMEEIGQKEIAGSQENNERIVEYFTATDYRATNDETPWCAAFVNWVLMKSETARTKSAAALSYKSWGAGVDLINARYGDIVVFDHGNGKGHVGFYVGVKADRVGVLGGNQSNTVNITWFSKAKVAHVRRAKQWTDSSTVAAGVAVGAVATGAAVTPVVDQLMPGLDQINMLFAYVPVEWQPVAQAVVTLLSTLWIINERLKRIKRSQV